MIICSRCGEKFDSGLDYRWHFDIHIEEWHKSKDKEKYIKETNDHIDKWKKKIKT